jgi:hypothetical protein
LIYTNSLIAQMTFLTGVDFAFGNGNHKGYFQNGNLYTSFNIETVAVGYGGLFYPKYHFMENEVTSLSVGMPFGLGFNSFSDNLGNSNIQFLVDAPAVVDINLGCLKLGNEEDKLGAFLGAGLGYLLLPSNKTTSNGANSNTKPTSGIEYSSINALRDGFVTNSVGAVIHAGFLVPNPFNGAGAKFGIRAGYHYGFTRRNMRVFSVGLIYQFSGDD